ALIRQLRKNPLMRMLRVDKLSYAALEATLLAYRRGAAFDEIPVLRMLSASKEVLRGRAQRLRRRLRQLLPDHMVLTVREGTSVVGGGSCPETALPTVLLALTLSQGSVHHLEGALRSYAPPILTRVEAGHLLIDLRTVLPEQEPILVA